MWQLPMPATRHQVKAAKDQIEEENRLNLAELPEDVTLLNPPKLDGAEAPSPTPPSPSPPPPEDA